MNVAIVIATCGDVAWADLAWTRAYPSVSGFAVPIAVHHYPDLTIAQARNAATDLASIVGADWFCFLDADDELEPGYIEAMETALAGAGGRAPLLVPAVRYVEMDEVRNIGGVRLPSRYSSSLPEIPNRGRWPALNECVIGTLVHADLFRKVGGFRDHTDDGTPISLYEDWDLFLRCNDAGAQLVYVEDAVYRAYVRPQGRNSGADAQVVYDAIWADHERRIKA